MIETILSQAWVQRLGWTLVHFLWQGTVIAAIYALVRVAMRRALSAQGRYMLACFALGAMTVAPLLTFLLLSVSTETLPWRISGVASEIWPRLLPGFVFFWLAGVLVFSVRLIGGWRFTARLRSTSHPAPPEWQLRVKEIGERVQTSRPVRLLVSSMVNVPAVVGWLRPAILVPVEALTGLPSDYLMALLAHELAHIRRHDYLTSVAQSLIEAALFYHPAVWWISAQIRVEREACCDDLAVIASGDVRTYVRALAELELRQRPRLNLALAANDGSLLHRIQRLIEPTEPASETLPGAGAAWAMTLLWLAGVGAASVHATPIHTKPSRVADVRPANTAISERPNPFVEHPDFTEPARKVLLFDPFLSAQVVRPAVGSDAENDVPPAWREWLDGDVLYIITPEERRAFLRLREEGDRNDFVEQFWLRRDPTPGTEENEYKQEHYRRIAFANAHFGEAQPGWRTDRGRVYITFGPPDEIRNTAAWSGTRPASAPDAVEWHYTSLPGTGNDVRVTFVDPGSGEFRLSSEIRGVQTPPGMGQLVPSPDVRFPDLESAMTMRTTVNTLPMTLNWEYLRGTGASTIVNLTLKFEGADLQFQRKDGKDVAVVNVFGRLTSMTRRPISTFEPTLEVVAEPNRGRATKVYQQSIPLPPGRYHVNIVAKDSLSGNMNNSEFALDVPHFDPIVLSASSLILADTLDKIPSTQVGPSAFAIGDYSVRPRVGTRFSSGEKMGVYFQIYNFRGDEKTQLPVGSIEYEVDRAGTGEKVLGWSEEVGSIPDASSSQVTVAKLLSLTAFPTGMYTLKVAVTDRIGNQTVQRIQNFWVGVP